MKIKLYVSDLFFTLDLTSVLNIVFFAPDDLGLGLFLSSEAIAQTQRLNILTGPPV
jgi:hypothetical protein